LTEKDESVVVSLLNGTNSSRNSSEGPQKTVCVKIFGTHTVNQWRDFYRPRTERFPVTISFCQLEDPIAPPRERPYRFQALIDPDADDRLDVALERTKNRMDYMWVCNHLLQSNCWVSDALLKRMETGVDAYNQYTAGAYEVKETPTPISTAKPKPSTPNSKPAAASTAVLQCESSFATLWAFVPVILGLVEQFS
jgi:hypothetical protein